jgi:hypothetical protein
MAGLSPVWLLSVDAVRGRIAAGRGLTVYSWMTNGTSRACGKAGHALPQGPPATALPEMALSEAVLQSAGRASAWRVYYDRPSPPTGLIQP